ncbi:MAG: hypothetical protein PHC34_10535 [Candidatus Gastranaerophilales bacterium]|nr:hypothetical protein [Candidatus Gastranaerophilales bacterium]
MKNQYLVIAENITYKYNKLSCINIYDQFITFSLPADSFFDLAVMCGPGWEPGEYDLKIKVQVNNNEPDELGSVKTNIPHDNFVYNAIAPNLKIVLPEGAQTVSFHVYKNEELILTRTYPINTLLVPKTEEQLSVEETISAE